MGYQLDPKQLYKKEQGSACIDIILGEEIGRGRGVGYLALQHSEQEIKEQGLHRIELGVFEFNTSAIKLYRRARYLQAGNVTKSWIRQCSDVSSPSCIPKWHNASC